MAAVCSVLAHQPGEAVHLCLKSGRRHMESSPFATSSTSLSSSTSSVFGLHSSCFSNSRSTCGSRNIKSGVFSAIICGAVKPCSSPIDHLENETMKVARKAFYDEINFRKRDDSISLAKAALLISVEDEAFILANRERDLAALQREGRRSSPPKVFPTDSVLLEGQSLSYWLDKLDAFAETVKASLGCSTSIQHPSELLRSFTKKSSLTTDPNFFYLHQVLTHGAGTAIMLGLIYIEVCRRLGLEMKGAPVGDDFLVWPSTETKVECRGRTPVELCAEMVFEPFKGGKVWYKNADGCYTRQQQVRVSDSSAHGPHPTKSLQAVSNRAILSILLRNLKRLYWKRAARAYSGSDITAQLALAESGPGLVNVNEQTLLRPQDLRLAVAASEKLLLLQPHDWLTRRDHGLLLYHSRRYGEAVQELSICMAVAPVHEVQVLEPFVEKLHLLRAESSWAASFSPNAPSALA